MVRRAPATRSVSGGAARLAHIRASPAAGKEGASFPLSVEVGRSRLAVGYVPVDSGLI